MFISQRLTSLALVLGAASAVACTADATDSSEGSAAAVSGDCDAAVADRPIDPTDPFEPANCSAANGPMRSAPFGYFQNYAPALSSDHKPVPYVLKFETATCQTAGKCSAWTASKDLVAAPAGLFKVFGGAGVAMAFRGELRTIAVPSQVGMHKYLELHDDKTSNDTSFTTAIGRSFFEAVSDDLRRDFGSTDNYSSCVKDSSATGCNTADLVTVDKEGKFVSFAMESFIHATCAAFVAEPMDRIDGPHTKVRVGTLVRY